MLEYSNVPNTIRKRQKDANGCQHPSPPRKSSKTPRSGIGIDVVFVVVDAAESAAETTGGCKSWFFLTLLLQNSWMLLPRRINTLPGVLLIVVRRFSTPVSIHIKIVPHCFGPGQRFVVCTGRDHSGSGRIITIIDPNPNRLSEDNGDKSKPQSNNNSTHMVFVVRSC